MAVAGTPWQLECKNLEQRCGYLLTSGIWSDCLFMVGSETNQEVVQAHKLVLAMASPVFEAMFYGGLSERNDPIIPIPDVQPEAFKALLQYIYTGNMNIGTLDLAWSVLYGAKKYMLPHVVQECKRYISSVLGPRNACRAYECAHLFDEKVLMDKCLKIISTNTKEVLNDSSFMDVELKTVIKVLSLDHLNVDRELDLFQAVARYAEAEQRRQGQISPAIEGGPAPEELPDKVLQSAESSFQTSPEAELDTKPSPEVVTSGTTAEKENSEEEEPTIRAALQHIRFLSLTAQEFAEGPARSGLLTRDESFRVLMNITSKDSTEPMPSGFSECRERRQSHSDSNDQCIVPGSLEHTINELKCGDPSRVQSAAVVAGNILGTRSDIQPALDKGILDALVPVLTEGHDECKCNAAWAIYHLCYCGSPSQLSVVAASAALQPYCRLLTAGGATCYWVLCGLTNLLEDIEQNTKDALLVRLRDIGVPQLLIPVQQDTDRSVNCEDANNLLQTYFSGGQ